MQTPGSKFLRQFNDFDFPCSKQKLSPLVVGLFIVVCQITRSYRTITQRLHDMSWSGRVYSAVNSSIDTAPCKTVVAHWSPLIARRAGGCYILIYSHIGQTICMHLQIYNLQEFTLREAMLSPLVTILSNINTRHHAV